MGSEIVNIRENQPGHEDSIVDTYFRHQGARHTDIFTKSILGMVNRKVKDLEEEMNPKNKKKTREATIKSAGDGSMR